MRKIRTGVFETNSSSCHSLCLSKDFFNSVNIPETSYKTGILDVYLSCYGWEWYRYYKLENKLSYILTSIIARSHMGASLQEDQKSIQLSELMPKFEGVLGEFEFKLLENIRNVVKEVFDMEICVHFSSDFYIDHESQYMYQDLALDNVKEFLLSPLSYIETGNDNSEHPLFIATDKGSSELYYPSVDSPILESDIVFKLIVPGLRPSPNTLKSKELYEKIKHLPLIPEIQLNGKSFYFSDVALDPDLRKILNRSVALSAKIHFKVEQEYSHESGTTLPELISYMFEDINERVSILFSNEFKDATDSTREFVSLATLKDLTTSTTPGLWYLDRFYNSFEIEFKVDKAYLESILGQATFSMQNALDQLKVDYEETLEERELSDIAYHSKDEEDPVEHSKLIEKIKAQYKEQKEFVNTWRCFFD